MEHLFLADKTILLVDDEPQLLELVSAILRDAGFCRILAATTGGEARTLCQAHTPHLALLDVNLPDIDGFSLMGQLCPGRELPVIFLTARDAPTDRLAGLGLGADDYIVKPFLPQELLLRVYAVLRRCYPQQPPLLELAACRVDLSRAQVLRAGQALPLTAKEHALLTALAQNAGRIVTIDSLCEALWGDNPFGYENSLMAHVCRLREKIEADPSRPVSLLTVKGLGYKLELGAGK